MNIKPIVIVSGEPHGIFNEIFLKIKKKKHFKKPIILIGCKKILLNQMKKLNYNFTINLLNHKNINSINLKRNNHVINLVNIDLGLLTKSKKETDRIRRYIQNCFDMSLKIVSKYKCAGIINGPINKKTFLNFKFPGVTEYLASKFKIKKFAMLIYTKNLSVCPITTHLPLKDVYKSISKKKIIDKVKIIHFFYKMKFKKTPKIAVTGLNPHCESPSKIKEENKFIIPAINILKKNKISIKGPFPTDTLFMKDQIKKFDVIIGMYHDQVLTPIKALYGFDAINITLGLPVIRISPDHGPNERMFGKNLSNPESLFQSIKFLDI
jgi:4-hydroxythreonine-4-phosphate dehydrogenase